MSATVRLGYGDDGGWWWVVVMPGRDRYAEGFSVGYHRACRQAKRALRRPSTVVYEAVERWPTAETGMNDTRVVPVYGLRSDSRSVVSAADRSLVLGSSRGASTCLQLSPESRNPHPKAQRGSRNTAGRASGRRRNQRFPRCRSSANPTGYTSSTAPTAKKPRSPRKASAGPVRTPRPWSASSAGSSTAAPRSRIAA